MKHLRATIFPLLCCLSAMAAGYLSGLHRAGSEAKRVYQIKDTQIASLTCEVQTLREQANHAAAEKSRMKREFEEQIAQFHEARLEREGRVVELPEDGEKWSLTLFLDPKWQTLSDPKLRKAQVDAEHMWRTEPWLVELRRETHSQIMLIDDPRAKVLHPVIPSTPCLLLQRACGEVIWKESGGKLSQGPAGLRRGIQKATKKHCPDGRCPVPLPVVGTPPAVPPAAEVPAVIAGEPSAAQPEDKKKVNAFVVLALCSAAFGVVLVAKTRRAAAYGA